MLRPVIFGLLLAVPATPAALVLTTPFTQDSIVFYDPPSPPENIDDFVAQSDAVIVVSVIDQANWEHPSSRFPLTEYKAHIVEVLKGDPRLPSTVPTPSTPMIQFLEIAGERRTARGLARTKNAASLKRNDKAIVFLQWAQSVERFMLLGGAHAAYIETPNGMRPANPDSALAKRWNGRSKDDLIRTLKAASRKK